MSTALRERVERVCQEIIQKHLDLLLVLLSEQGASPGEQRERAEVLVRALDACQLSQNLTDQGRRVPALLDERARPARIMLGEDLLAQSSHDALRFALTRPIAQLLSLPAISVGLVLQGTDEQQLRNLYHGAQSRLDTPVLRSTQVRAVIERRITSFAERVRALTLRLAQARVNLPSPATFMGALAARTGAWPEWDEIAADPFMAQIITTVRHALVGHSQLPPAEILTELCWESLDLSPQSFLKHVGRALRNQDALVHEGLLRAIAEVVAPGRVDELSDIAQWPSMQELRVVWERLHARELATLGRFHLGASAPPPLSVFASPALALGLREPEDLPFHDPLVCWSVREINALRDLLIGLTQGHGSEDEDDVELLLVDAPSSRPELPMAIAPPRRRVEIQVIGTDIEMPPGYDILQQRAWRAACSRLRDQLLTLEHAQQQVALKRIRGAFEGFFERTAPVWARRLQGWQLDPPIDALARMVEACREVFGVDVFIDPFESPQDSNFRLIPTFTFIVAASTAFERLPFRIPIAALVNTGATGAPPLRVRFVDVPGEGARAANWLCDRDLTMTTMQGYPVQLTLRAVQGDMLRMLAYE